MIVETLAIVAILRDEPDAAQFAGAIECARIRRLSVVSDVEAAVVVDGSRDPVASRKVDDFIREVALELRQSMPNRLESHAKPIATLARAAAIRPL